MSGEGAAERLERLTQDAFRVVKISRKRKRQDRYVIIVAEAGVVITADAHGGSVRRFLTWESMEGFRILGAGHHGAMVVFRCREEPDVCVELQGDSRKPPHEVLAVLRETAQQQGLEWTEMPAGTDMAAEAVCRRVGRTKIQAIDHLRKTRIPRQDDSKGDDAESGGRKKVAIHPHFARTLGSGASQLHFFGVVGVVGAINKHRLLMVVPDLLFIANFSGDVCRAIAMKDIEEIRTLADGSSTPLRLRFRVRGEADVVAFWISHPFSTHPEADALLHDLREAVLPSVPWRVVHDLQLFNEGCEESKPGCVASILRRKA
eukprot:TRINITY_DN5776_c0_g2_i1.p1 TRINITY_DN5776_c0_g2~~TRINITY_DN5776_c0_g2_i1.p1  ORF type:complete len:318 (+),score=51.00 TRINITY_DN5776_c0_g2_i1:47-1000(+)